MSREHVLDVRGEDCPGPLVKVVRKIARMPVGDRLKVLTDVEECVALIRETVEAIDLRVDVNYTGEGYWVMVIEKNLAKPRLPPRRET